MDKSGFEELVKQVQSGWMKQSPEALLFEWKNVVEECEGGYSDTVNEYRFDLQVRDSIAEVLADEQLATMPEMTSFREEVDLLDQRLKAVLRNDAVCPPDKYPWWHAYPLSYGTEEIAEEYRIGYGIDITVVPKWGRKP